MWVSHITYEKHLTMYLAHCESSILLFVINIQRIIISITHAPCCTLPSGYTERPAFLTLKYTSPPHLEVKNHLKE